MNIQPFLEQYPEQEVQLKSKKKITLPDDEFQELIHRHGGLCVQKGLFRIYTPEQSEKWTTLLSEAFDDLEGEVVAYGRDWMGRQFAKQIGQPMLVMVDIAEGDFYTTENSLEGFFNDDLIEYAEDTLQIELFNTWNTKGVVLQPDEIVGYLVPLKLGGQDSVENRHVIDAEVDWELNKQLHQQTN